MGMRILIVEDNPQNLELMRYLLAAHGYQVLTAVDGAAATDVLEGATPDLILCDIQMPRMNGFDLLAWVRSRDEFRKIPMVAVTALAMVGDREEMLAAGFDGYLSKPITPETFVGEVTTFIVPRGSDDGLPPRGAAGTRKLPDTDAPQVLLVDNLQYNLDLAEIVLEHLGYRTVQARGMKQALERLETLRPALILSDVCMDDGDGFALLQAVKRDPRLRDVPVVLITSTRDNAADRRHGLEMGAARYLYRPIDPHVLKGELEACLRRSKPES